MARPLIIGLGGTTRDNSSTELALRASLRFAEEAGADVELLTSSDLDLPMYGMGGDLRTPKAQRLIGALRRADGVIIASPGYHGSISGLLKNALDYVEDLRGEAAPYLDGRAVGCIATAYGPQAMGTTLSAMRSIIHALRGWPTPMAAAFTATADSFDAAGHCVDDSARMQLRIVAEQVVEFAHMRAAYHALNSANSAPRLAARA